MTSVLYLVLLCEIMDLQFQHLRDKGPLQVLEPRRWEQRGHQDRKCPHLSTLHRCWACREKDGTTAAKCLLMSFPGSVILCSYYMCYIMGFSHVTVSDLYQERVHITPNSSLLGTMWTILRSPGFTQIFMNISPQYSHYSLHLWAMFTQQIFFHAKLQHVFTRLSEQ